METRHTLVTADGANLAYGLWHSRAPRGVLVLLHGMASNRTRWSEFLARTSLKDTWDILRPDLRGHGDSMARGTLNLDRWSDDIAAVLARHGYARAVLTGHCLGANIALRFARRHAPHTAGLVLIEPMFREALTGRLAKALAIRPLLRRAIHLARLLNRLGIKRRRFPSIDLAALDRDTRIAMTQSGSTTPLVRRYAAPWQDLRYMPIANYLQALIAVSEDLPGLNQISAPVLALLSSGSTFSDAEKTLARLSDIPDVSIVTLDAHHWIPAEKPEEMRAAIEHWCAGLHVD
jgi:pimeloyl-ACP methyl ester carboxylesterase